MAQKTNLNVAPYYDDFNSANNFNRVLFRPGYAIQARELTQLQTTLQDQISKHGDHIFAEGAMVVPGQLCWNDRFPTLKLATQFTSQAVIPSQFYNATTPVIIHGQTSGVKAQVIGYSDSTSTDQPVLHLRYLNSGNDYTTAVFADGENLRASVNITHDGGTTNYTANTQDCATTFTATSSTTTDPKGPASATGCSANVEPGVYYIRGMFVENTEQTVIVSKYSALGSAKIGFTISETLITPESDSTLTDNATGSNNYAAKGAHRLKVSLTLASLPITSTADSTFVELMRVKSGAIQSHVRNTDYSVLEETLARRTFDESGDYTVRPFQFTTHESVTIDDDEGLYGSGATTDDGNTASESMLAFKVSPGKAYVKGYEIEKLAPIIKDVNKARDTISVNNGVSLFSIGNYTLITDVHHQPDITNDGGTITEFKPVYFYNEPTSRGNGRGHASSTGSGTGLVIGSGRVRHMESHTSPAGSYSGNYDSKYKLFLFDIKPYTRVAMTGTIANTLVVGDFITGSTSGASAFIVEQVGSDLYISSVVGNFSIGETITVNDRDVATTETIMTIRAYSFGDFKQVYQETANGVINFTADLSLEDTLTLSGTYRTEASAGNGLVGVSGYNTSEVVAGDIIEIPTGTSGGTEDRIVESISSSAISFLVAPTTGAITTANAVRKRAKLFDTEKNVGIVKLPKKVIKKTSDHTYTVRRQFIISESSTPFSLPGLTGETYVAPSESDYSVSVVSDFGTGGALVIGDLIQYSDLTFTDSSGAAGGNDNMSVNFTNLAANDTIKVIATISRNTNAGAKTKDVVLSKALKVDSTSTGVYGTNNSDKTISLGRADIFKLQAIYDSESEGSDAVPPSLAVGSITGTFTRGEVITGGTSGAKARLITTTTPLYYVLSGTTDFSAAETITGAYSTASTTVSSVTAGSTVITSNYLLDTGQRDNYYDISRIVRKPSAASPSGRLLIIYDYMEHGTTGDYFSVESYVDSNDSNGLGATVNVNAAIAVNQMDYNDIPKYSATKVDPDESEPSGEYPLADCFDFRPTVQNITGTQASFYTDGGTGVDEITANSFDFTSRVFSTSNGSSTLNFPKPDTDIRSDFDYYLNKRALVSIDKDGDIVIKEGASAEVPKLPKPNDGAMLLASLYIPAFTFKPKDVEIQREKNQRFTMKDIGRLKDRIEHVEYYTALNMLERDAESFEIQDANGLNRFKSGFVVDNCSGHRVGDVQHVDYRIGMNMEEGEMRPIHNTEAVALEESVSTDTLRTNAHYQKTGDLITLPYTEEEFTSQPYATTCEKVTPLLTSNWLGLVELTPDADEWFETEIAPRLVINVEGNYNTFLAANQDKIGTVWNSWQTGWSGVVNTQRRNEGQFTRVIQTIRQDSNRTGIRTEVVPKVDEESQGFRHLYDTLIPFCRSKSIQFDGWGFRPNTRVYPFFDKKSVAAHTTPLSTDYTSGSVAAGQPLITTQTGKIEGTFVIPDPKTSGNPKFETGEVQFRLSSSSTDAIVPEPTTAGDTIYFAKGILETHQETVIATRNAELARTSVTQTTSRFSSSTSMERNPPPEPQQDDSQADNNDNGPDPLAQTFLVDKRGGAFITSIDLYFCSKDETLPMWVELRNVINGYPGPKILPFGRKVMYPDDVTVSADASVATKVTFPSPVYVEEGQEYTIALLAAGVVNTWTVYISRMGQVEIGGSRTVSMQPHTGVLFKSHNNRAWAMSGMEDLKFTINIAKFDNSKSGTVTLQNSALPIKSLKTNPLEFTDGLQTIRINHRNHGMYATNNNVTISGVSSSLSTTLNGDISSVATTINLTSGTNFNNTSGKYKHNDSSEHFIKIDDEIIKYTNASISGATISAGTVTRGAEGTTAASHNSGAIVELYQLYQIPLSEINKTHTAISEVSGVAGGNQLDYYTITTSTTFADIDSNTAINATAPGVDGVSYVIVSTGSTDFTAIGAADSNVGTIFTHANSGSASGTGTMRVSGIKVSVGGNNVTSTQNQKLDSAMTLIGNMELPGTSITPKIRPTTATSPSGIETSFTKVSGANAITIPLNDNYHFDTAYMVASGINESNLMSSTKSLNLALTLASNAGVYISPVIDTQRMSLLCVSNRINKVTGSGSYTITNNYSQSTDPDGDDNSAIYMTKQVLLENPATAIRLLFAGHRLGNAEILGMYKILRTDDATEFDDIGWSYFNTTGVTDTTTKASLSDNDFQQYNYSAGVKDDGTGTALDPFIGFSIKLIMQSTNSAEAPRVKDLRAIALAT